MADSCAGFTDKLYWRPITGRPLSRWCCFKKVEGGTFESLCGQNKRKRSGGQASARPPSMLRCGRCDNLEADRREWDDCGVTNPNWKEHAAHGR